MSEHERTDSLHLTDEAIRLEIEHDRKAERWLWARGAVALLAPAAIILVKVVWFP